AGDVLYLVWAGALVLLMIVGFGLMEAGSVRIKNSRPVLLRKLIEACVGAITWYLIGNGLAYGGANDNPFLGTGGAGYAIHTNDWKPGYSSEGYEWAHWFYYYAIALVASSIVSGSVTERATMIAHLIYCCCAVGVIFPVAAHWIWDPSGMLSAYNLGTGESAPVLGGAIDWAGGGAVFMVAGLSALFASLISGPRIGRFDEFGAPVPIRGHNPILTVLGVLLLWTGWYGFVAGANLSAFSAARGHGMTATVARTCVVTTISAATGGLTSVGLIYFLAQVWDVMAAANGVLVGLVSISAGAGVVEPWAAIWIGSVGAVLFLLTSRLMIKQKIDDTMDAFAVYGVGGMWSVLAVGMFCRPEYSHSTTGGHGFLYGGVNGDLILAQIVYVLILVVWTTATSLLLFGSLRYFDVLRLPEEIERLGMD
ncbi:ammonium transporter AmtB-like domain-containing protein, partial [Pavlovales sp. CCMP2436]